MERISQVKPFRNNLVIKTAGLLHPGIVYRTLYKVVENPSKQKLGEEPLKIWTETYHNANFEFLMDL